MRGALGTATVCIVFLATGCTREHYRRHADADTNEILHEKTCDTPWELAQSFSPYPDPRSRLAHPDSPDCPELPASTPRLHTYELPSPAGRPLGPILQPQPATSSDDSDIRPAVALQLPVCCTSTLLGYPIALDLEKDARPSWQDRARNVQPGQLANLPLLPIPESAWRALPRSCLMRMLQFASVREEYRGTFGDDVPAELREVAPPLSLDELVELALLNSREYQAQKESLYKAALALTLERFDCELKFTPTGNGTVVDYKHARTDGKTVNTLDVASSFGLNKMLATGGNLLARFANDVVLTFNGPQGFVADVNSELFLGLSQSLLQRDIRFEPLVQSERNVVYAGRDFARFRKTFFFDRSAEYYALVRRYRQIEIESLSYFSLVRALNQAEAEELAGLQTRIQVEQIEQSMLEGRRRLATTSNGLDSGLDRLKISMGLPTETALDLDLDELRQLNLRDEIQVAADRTTRALRRVHTQRQKQPPNRSEILNSAIVLNDRLLDWLRLRQRGGQQIENMRELELLVARLRVEEARLASDQARDDLQRTLKAEPAAPAVQVFQRASDTADALRRLITQQLELASALGANPQTIADASEELRKAAARSAHLRERLDTVLKEAQIEQLDVLVRDAEQLLVELESQVHVTEKVIGDRAERFPAEQQLELIRTQVGLLIDTAERLLKESEMGLLEVEIQPEEAMLTALVLRLDLMNERGQLADARRLIKLAADDLRSVLNLGAEETIRNHKNRPFDFTFDESVTRLALTLDLPLNRLAQRNVYRRSLLDYEAALRSLTLSEDNIKLSIRDELRGLALARDQYQISVASAALAAERVESTRIQLALGFPGVAARDFLEAQDAYRVALGAVADDHIGYIVDRARFFLDSELMQLDESGFWRELHHENFQPSPRHDFEPNAGPPYGEVPDWIWLSHELRRIFDCQP